MDIERAIKGAQDWVKDQPHADNAPKYYFAYLIGGYAGRVDITHSLIDKTLLLTDSEDEPDEETKKRKIDG